MLSAKLFAVLLIMAAAAFAVYRDDREVVLIDPFSVPKSLEERGITAAYLSAGISDALSALEAGIASSARKDTVLLSKDEALAPDIEIPSTGLSLRTVHTFFRRWMNREPAHISGEVVTIPPDSQGERAAATEITFRVVRPGRPAIAARVRLARTDPEAMVQESAKAILKAINPHQFCAYLIGTRRDLDAAGTLAQELVTRRDYDRKAAALGYRLWANVLVEQERLDEATRRYTNALQLAPDDALAYNNLGVVLERQKRLPEAIAAFQKAIALSPRLALARFNLGKALSLQHQPKKAEQAYAAAVKADPALVDAWIDWGVMLALQGRSQEAADRFDAAITQDPRSAIAYYNLGNLMNKQGRLADAALRYETAVILEPKLALAWVGWGMVLESQGDNSGAAVKYRNAVVLDAQLADAYIGLGNVSFRLNELDEAIANYTKAQELGGAAEAARKGLEISLAERTKRLGESKLVRAGK
jgi:tetratricopeptide (TPR) repeat protein